MLDAHEVFAGGCCGGDPEAEFGLAVGGECYGGGGDGCALEDLGV